jgi:membrane associated rhomboid family serine protease
MDLPETHFSGDDESSWLSVSPHPDAVTTRQQAHSWALVLDSRTIPCSIESEGEEWRLMVPEQQLESALRELRLYEQANRNWPPSIPAARQLIENTLPTVSVLILLATFHNLTLLGLALPEHGILDLHELGMAHAAKIVDGELWRCITALTLHGGLVHLLGNLTIGGTFIILLCSEFGSGLAWSLLLTSGAFGNLLNSWVQSPDHRSVGASTVVFGAVGIHAAISTLRYRNRLQRRWFVPVAAGLALLAVLGTEGKQTDLGAHLFGFINGIIFGMAAEYLVSRYGRPGGALNFLLVIICGALVAAAWWAAITMGG